MPSDDPTAGWAPARLRSWPRALMSMVALLGIGLLAFWPVWLDGQTTMAALGTTKPLAAAYVDEPLAAYAAAARERGEAVLWNPHNGLGVPLLGAATATNPLRVPVLLFPDSALAFDATYLLRLLVAASGALFLARRLGLGDAAALASGVAFGLTGAMVWQPSWAELDAEVWLPWTWLAADVLARSPGLRPLVGYAVAVFAIAAGGAPPTWLATALALLGFAVWRRAAWGMAGLVRVGVCAVPPVLLASGSWLAGLEYLIESVPNPLPAAAAPRWIGWTVSGLVLLGLGHGLGRGAFLWACLAASGAASLMGFGAFYAPAALAAALLVGAGVDRWAPARGVARHGAEVLVLLVLLLEVVVAGPAAAPRRTPLWPEPGFTGALGRDDPATYRVLALGGTLLANQNAAIGLDQLGLAGRRVPRRFAALASGLPPPLLQPRGGDELAPWTETVAARLLDLCNVRYFVLPAGAGPARPPPDLDTVLASEGAVVLRRATALPRAFFPRRIERVAGPAQAIDRMMAGSSADAAEVAYLETTELRHRTGPPSGSARPVARSADGGLELSVQASAAGYLIVSVLFYPGFEAEIEQRGEVTRAEIVAADAALSAVAVPRGRYTVRFSYRPTWESLALGLRTAGALLLLVLAAAILRNPGAPD